MKISLFTTCRNREKNLKLALPSWQSQNVDEIIILDYGSEKPIEGAYRVEADKFQITKALNIAESICTGDILIKVDADYILNVDIVNLVNLQKGEFYTGAYVKKYISGFLMCWRHDFEKVNGYNERMLYYGEDDIDLYNRLEMLGLEHKKINGDWITHIDHTDSQRLKEYGINGRRRKHFDYYGKKNIQVSKEMPWNQYDIRSKYEII
jgi:glycosyltransferase involved in cell wall biosynthesis